MEAKKTARADLENKRGLIFNISLVISLSLVIMAFEWKQGEPEKQDLTPRTTNTFELTPEVPVTEIQPPPPPAMVQPRIIEVPNEERVQEEIEVNFDTEVTEMTKVTSITIAAPAPEVEKEEEPDKIFLVVEQKAEPKGGLGAFYKDISERIQYPSAARRMGVEGRVFVEFVVNRDGTLTDIVVVKGIGAGCDEEAARVIAEAPAWNPAKQRGRPVRQRMVLPITFKIKQ